MSRASSLATLSPSPGRQTRYNPAMPYFWMFLIMSVVAMLVSCVLA